MSRVCKKLFFSSSLVLRLGRKNFTFLMLGLLAWGASASAKPTPDLTGTWHLNCLSGYQSIVSTMDAKLVPDSLVNGFDIRGTTAHLTNTPTVPWLSIYNKDLKPIYHGVGYNLHSDGLWQLVTQKNRPTKFAPALYQIEPFTGVRAVDLPGADFTFVAYHADWCTQCQLQDNALADFKNTHPNLRIAYVRIDADTAKMQKKKYRSKTCPI